LIEDKMKIKIGLLTSVLLMLISCSSNGQRKFLKDNISDDEVLIEYAIFLLEKETLSPESVLETIRTSYS